MTPPTGPRDLPWVIFEFRERAFSRYTIAFSRVHVRQVSDFGRGLPGVAKSHATSTFYQSCTTYLASIKVYRIIYNTL